MHPARDLMARPQLRPLVARPDPQPESIQIGYPRSHRLVPIPAGLHKGMDGLLCHPARIGDLHQVARDPDHRPVVTQVGLPATPTAQWHHLALTAYDLVADAS